MVRHAEPYRAPLWVLQALWHLPGCRQEESIRSGRHRLDEPVGPVVYPRIGADLGQVAANQCEIVLLVCAANSVNSINRSLVANVTAECVARIGWVGDQSATLDYLHDLPHTARLWVGRMNFDEFGHARIVGTWLQDARSENPVSFPAVES